MTDWKKLKSGSDVRGKAIGEDAVLTENVAKALGYSFVQYLKGATGKDASQLTIAVGRDSRVSGPALKKAVLEGILSGGANAADYGMCTTPSMYMCILTDGFRPDGSIMITASHHPWQMNGLKFFTKEGGIGFAELDDILSIAQETAEFPLTEKQPSSVPFLPSYANFLKRLIQNGLGATDGELLKGLHVVVDAGNGAGGFYAEVLRSLGADISGSQFLDPDGMFPNHIPNPENAAAMDSVSEAVLRSGADLGVIFDTDCDRAAIVDGQGREINRNRLIAVISAVLLETNPGATIVTDSVTSSGLTAFIAEAGGVHYRYKRGYRNVIDKALELNAEGVNCPLAIETSGHAALRQNHFLDDGMYLVTLLIIKAMQLKRNHQTLGSLLKTLREPVESVEIRLPILSSDFAVAANHAIESVARYAAEHDEWHIAPDNREGFRVSFNAQSQNASAWFLIRQSVHDPVMPVNAESDVPGGVKLALSELFKALQGENALDLSPLADSL